MLPTLLFGPFAVFVELAPVGFDDGMLPSVDDLLMVDCACLKAHVAEGDVGSQSAADLGVGAGVEGLDELLEGGGHVGDVVYHPVVFDGFLYVVGFRFGLKVGGELDRVMSSMEVDHWLMAAYPKVATAFWRNLMRKVWCI